MEEEIVEDIDEIDTLIAELEISIGKGNILLCVVNSPLYRDRIIRTLRGRFSSKIITVVNGEQIISILKTKDFNVVEVIIWIMPEESNEDMLNTLNNFRELFYEKKVPNVIFFNQAFSESVIKIAPDFWRYRGNYYEFKVTEGDLTFEALEALTTTLIFKDKEDLLRRKRINEYLLEKVRDKKEKSNILGELGILSNYFGEVDKALGYFEEALKLDEELEDKEEIAVQFGNIGSIYSNKGELDEALEYHEKALKLDEELGDKEGIASELGNMGNIYRMKGNIDKALEYFEKSLELDESVGDKEGIAIQLGNIGIAYRIRGELDKALEYHEKALELDEELGNKVGIATQHVYIGNVYTIKGEHNKALKYYEKALKLSEELGIKETIASLHGNIGTVYRTKGEHNKALEYYERALVIFKEMGSRVKIAQALMNIGDVLVNKSDKEHAIDYYMKAQELAKGSYLFEEINKKLQRLRKKGIPKDIQKSTLDKAME
jgi:tetratricopeptide (TPR) repeat protein